jgi:hypothetical protein
MLSHLKGAARRVDLRHLKQAVAGAEAERKRAKFLQTELRRERAARAEAERLAGTRESELDRLSREVAAERARYEGSGPATELGVLRAVVASLRAELAGEKGHAKLESARCHVLESDLEVATSANAGMKDEIDALVEEAGAAEQQILLLLSELEVGSASPSCAGRRDDCPASLSLNGKRVLYVGGRTGLVRHYRELVERRGGRFSHHDGGLEERTARLDGMVRGAEVVMCPVDAVSHGACLRVKKACKRGARPFVPLRSQGVASLASALQVLVGRRAAGRLEAGAFGG